MINAGILGGAGYVAGELLRLLVHHPDVNIRFVYSHSQPGKRIGDMHHDLFASDLVFTDEIDTDVDVVFLCLGHGQAKEFLSEHEFASHTKIIDLSNDFRLAKHAAFGDWNFVYGLVELNKDKIKNTNAIANPGCFASAIELALLPLANAKAINDEIHVHALTGSTGAGQSLTETSHFSWRSNNISIYKAFAHQHLGEIRESIVALDSAFDQPINFIPMRGDFARGIFASVYTNSDYSDEELTTLYKDFYADAPFTSVYHDTVHLKQVVNTNHCLLQVQKLGDKVHITSVLDNLLKGASGQAVQNMNLMFGIEETAGLQLKATFF